MRNIRPNVLLIKPHLDPGNASDCELEALKFLKSWKRARDRQAVRARVNDPETIEVTQPKPKRSHSAAVA